MNKILACLAAAVLANDFSVKDVAIHLPDGWRRDSNSGDEVIFRNSDDKFQLTLGAHAYSGSASRSDFERLLKLRLAAQKAGGDEARAEPIRKYRSGFSAEFAGANPNRSFAGRLMLADGMILTAYLEGVEVSPAEFAKMRAAVIPGIEIKPR